MMQPAPTAMTEICSDGASAWQADLTFQDDTEVGSALAIELEKTKTRVKKLEEALYTSFPIELYKQARPDIETDCDG